MSKKKCLFHWSGGKDSSIALLKLLKSDEVRVDLLLTSVNKEHNRVTMHGVRRELIERQAESIGLPLDTVELPEQPDMATYDKLMSEKMETLRDEGFTHAAFGDIFLEDLKKYREKQMKQAGFEPLFPIWQEDTSGLIRNFIDDGFKAVVVSANSDKLDRNFAGRVINREFLNDLPDDVDPCGENGEFHTFVYDGPIFKNPISFKLGEVIYREYDAPGEDELTDGHSAETDPKKMGFWFCDLLPE